MHMHTHHLIDARLALGLISLRKACWIQVEAQTPLSSSPFLTFMTLFLAVCTE